MAAGSRSPARPGSAPPSPSSFRPPPSSPRTSPRWPEPLPDAAADEVERRLERAVRAQIVVPARGGEPGFLGRVGGGEEGAAERGRDHLVALAVEDEERRLHGAD